MQPASSNGRRQHRGLTSLIALFLLAASIAQADWPTDPTTPVVAGDIVGFGIPSHDIAVNPDGSTWIAWVNDQCFGEVRVQRISPYGGVLRPDGVLVDTFDICNTPSVRMVACDDGSVVVAGGTDPIGIHRFNAIGEPLWGNGIEPAGDGGSAVASMLALPDGEVMVLWYKATDMLLARYTAAGDEVWSPQVLDLGPSNRNVFAMVSDDAGGAFIIWDSPLTYVRRIQATRVAGDGTTIWPGNVAVSEIVPGTSRHTPPTAVEDGQGGVFILWTQGTESAHTPVPLRLQHLAADGSRTFEPEGRRVSLDADRQFDPVIARNGAELAISWRDGVQIQEVRAQLMTLGGTRVWGDNGIQIAPLAATSPTYLDLQWQDDSIAIVVANDSGDPDGAALQWHGVSHDGALEPPTDLSGPAAARSMVARAVADGLVVTWATGNFEGHVLAHHVMTDGTVGSSAVAGDATGDGIVSLDDLLGVLASWGICDVHCTADFDGNGAVTVGDLLVVLANWR